MQPTTYHTAVIVGTGSGLSASLARAFARAGAHVMEMLSRGTVLGLVALLVASAFTTELYSKQLYLLLATGPALRAMARWRETEALAVDTRL